MNILSGDWKDFPVGGTNTGTPRGCKSSTPWCMPFSWLDYVMDVGDRSTIGFRLALKGQINFIQGDFDSARRNFKECLSVVMELDDRHAISDTLLIVSYAYATVEPPTAVIILGAIQAYYENRMKEPMYPLRKRDFDNTITQASWHIGDSAFITAWAEGGKMALDEALELALKSLDKINNNTLLKTSRRK